MAQSASLQTQGLEKMLKKLNPETLAKPIQRRVIQEVADAGADKLKEQLSPRFPVTAGTVKALYQTNAFVAFARGHSRYSAVIRAARFPYVFFERGSQYPVARQLGPASTGVRKHRVRRGISNSALRIKPRRFLSKTRAYIRRELAGAVEKATREIEKDWAA